MNRKKLKHIWITIITLLIVILCIRWMYSPEWIENVYTEKIYRHWATIQRAVTRIFPFSVGDIFYAVLIILLLKGLVKLVISLIRRRFHWIVFFVKTSSLIKASLIIYLVFILFWGLNYDRKGIANQLQLKNGHYTTEELQSLTHSLLGKINTIRRSLGGFDYVYPSYEVVFAKTKDAYKEAMIKYPFLEYNQPCIKRSLYGRLGNYSGFTGYYNPFSGEAQVNVRVPEFYLPYVTCHEVAHQLGYGDESEANFVGFLACKASKDTVFKYSVYFDLFNYANNELFYRDSMLARENYLNLDTLVKKDIQTARIYRKRYKNPLAPLIQAFYGEYLKIHNQPQGIDSYEEVTGWLIAYMKENDL